MKETPFETIGHIKETCICGKEFTIKIRTYQNMFMAEGKCNKCGYAYVYWDWPVDDAEERSERCHSYCDRYKQYRGKMKAINRQKRIDNELYQALVEQVIRNKSRNTKKWGNKDEN